MKNQLILIEQEVLVDQFWNRKEVSNRNFRLIIIESYNYQLAKSNQRMLRCSYRRILNASGPLAIKGGQTNGRKQEKNFFEFSFKQLSFGLESLASGRYGQRAKK